MSTLRTVYIETYGCWLNKGESGIMLSLLEEAGFIKIGTPEKADLIIVNTCAVRDETERKILRRLKTLNTIRKPDSKLLIAGCLATYRPGFLALNIPSASLLSTFSINKVVEAALARGRVTILDLKVERPLHLPKPREGGRVVAPIAVGCPGGCTYCVMPLSRGPLRSYPPHEVLRYIKEAFKAGAREVYLVAQDSAAYGLDIGSSLPNLLKDVCKLEGDFMVRVGMMEPSTTLKILTPLLEAYDNDKVYKFLHCPVQSGSDKVLELANRRYGVRDFLSIVEAYRSKYPEGSLVTDIIVGLPGETEVDFELSCKLLEKIEPDKVHVARFDPRPLTPAALMKHPQESVKKAMSRKLTHIVDELAYKRNKAWIGKAVEVLVTDEVRGASVIGRTYTYKPVVLSRRPELAWRKVKSLIIEARPHYLKAITL